MRIKLGAVIPTVQYGNLQPEFEIETTELYAADAMEKLEENIQHLWDKYGEKPLIAKTTTNRKLLKAFAGGEVYYDEATHTYSNEAGEIYESGSQYAKKFEKPFDGAAISNKMAAKYGVEASDLVDMWELKARTSREFGSAMHSALELYGRYNGLAKALERETHLHDSKPIKQAVSTFFAGREDEEAEYEILIVDHKTKRAGRVDRLLVTGEKSCRVGDFKTNAVMDKIKLGVYWNQLSFYAAILNAGGWAVEGLDIHHYDGEWEHYSSPVLEVR